MYHTKIKVVWGHVLPENFFLSDIILKQLLVASETALLAISVLTRI